MPNVKLQSRDGANFTVAVEVAKHSGLLRTMLEDLQMTPDDEPISLPNVDALVLKKVLEWCSYHTVRPEEEREESEMEKDDQMDEQAAAAENPQAKPIPSQSAEEASCGGDEQENFEMTAWDKAYLTNGVDSRMLLDIINAANYLDIKGLEHLGCSMVADMFKNTQQWGLDSIRQTFGIENDLTEEEENDIKKTFAWSDDKNF